MAYGDFKDLLRTASDTVLCLQYMMNVKGLLVVLLTVKLFQNSALQT